jgi:hypothetical protein
VGLTWVVFRAVLGAATVVTMYSESSVSGIAGLITFGLLAFGAYRWWRAGDRYLVFKDELYLAAVRREQGDDSGPFAVGDEEQEVSGVIELFSQIFVGGPRLICTGIARIQSRLPDYLDLEARMGVLLERLRALKKWQPGMAYVDQAEELGALMRCGLVEFSSSKMIVKAVGEKSESPAPEAEDDAPEAQEPARPATPVPAAFVSPGVPTLANTPQTEKPITKLAGPVRPPPKAPPVSPAEPKSSPEDHSEADGGTPV